MSLVRSEIDACSPSISLHTRFDFPITPQIEGMPRTSLTTTPLAKNDVQLASLIPDWRKHHQDALNKLEMKIELVSDEDYTNSLDKYFSNGISDESKSFFKVAIARIVSGL